MTALHDFHDRDATVPVTLTWPGDHLMDEDLRRTLCGPGAPFERTVEDVLGTPLEVFAHRPPHLPALLVRARETMPDLPYLVFDGPEKETLTFARTHDLVAAYARVLAERHGVGKGDRVAVAAPNAREYVLAYWATLSLGAILVGLNGWWTAAEMDYGVELTEPVVVLGSGTPLERVSGAPWVRRTGTPVVALKELHRAALSLEQPPTALPRVELHEDDPAAIMFTSGTTGRPKGATISHRNFVYFTMHGSLGGAVNAVRDAGRYRQQPPDVQRASLCVSPLFHVSGAGVTIAVAPAVGLKVVFPGPGRWEAERVLKLTDEHLITQWSGVPTHYWRLLDHPDFDRYRTDQVTLAGSGGAVFAPELMRSIQRRMPGVQLGNGYGMTETLGTGTLINGSLLEEHPDSVGPAIPCTRVQVRGLDGEPLPEGEIGEIHIQGPGVFLGYWRNPEATEAVLAPGRWYRTGDYGRITDGRLYLESRIRDLILRGGENIYPIEIEHRLVEHPGIAEACVIGVPHRILGQEVKAFVVPEKGSRLTVEEVRAWAGETLAAFKVPAYVEFRDALPYNETGKVMKRLLEEEHEANP
ncbi:Acyl-CoA synthetase (AMP-forming)/AMP-acid ligase II [Thermomonospora echinospora]|uniref:Acyl-CoA synthetase (AMP-forming)/AMP-acid ligase II n=1 Tax=Thermomonospora echinospora TaxID=1992 RepID=A0A1H6E720_9ACTN|nr:class I adenylate-forming enzyme family protein [Thermomonospora echinospora]SEG93502.1 Acyl-CoA synthetase (AMP-forming)/AMP-acid ligase II [Thermomonospora echinospora]